MGEDLNMLEIFNVEKPIILDCDTGEDDALAILVAVTSRLPLQYIVTSHGNTDIDNSTRNTSRLLSYVGTDNIKVVRGSSRSLQTHLHKPEGESAGDYVGKNGLCNVELPASRIPNIITPDEQDFPSFLSELIKSNAPLDYIITGPCTNFAKACMFLGNSIHHFVKNVYIMGGAVYESGNSGPKDPSTGKQFAEFNFYCDPPATQVVLDTELPIHLVTWDITSKLTVPHRRISGFRSESPIGQFTINLMSNFFNYYGLDHDRNFELNDPITVLAQMGLGRYREEWIRIVTDGIEYGRSVPDPSGHKVDYFYLESGEEQKIIDIVLKSLDLEG